VVRIVGVVVGRTGGGAGRACSAAVARDVHHCCFLFVGGRG
jgi:hypothetical protein